jgi:hypothetical protein
MDQTNGTALRARFAETRAEFFTDTVVNGDLQVTGPSQFQGVEASGVVAEQVVWVTGINGAPQSVMFPGSLQLGKWRSRGSESSRYVVERLDDDGAVQTNGWVQAAAIVHDANTNASTLEVDLVRAPRLLIGPDPLNDPAFAVWVNGKLRATDNLETAAKLRTDTVSPFSDSVSGIVRVEGIALTVEGELRADTIRARDVNGTTSVSKLAVTGSLTVGGLSVQGGNPYFCAGRVNANATSASSIGRVGYTVTRHWSQPAGVYEIRFTTPAPNNNYVVTLTQQGSGNIKLWDSTVNSGPPTAERFFVVTYNTSWALADFVFHFAVVT